MIRNLFLYMMLALVLAYPTVVTAETTAAAASGTTLNEIGTVYARTATVISGKSDLPEVIVKVISPSQLNVFYDVVKTSDGAYSTSFTLSEQAETGTYTVVAGKGSAVATGSFQFVKQNSHNRGSGGSGSGSGGGTGAGNAGDVEASQTTVEFKSADLSKSENGTVTLNVDFAADKSGVVVKLPANLSQLVGDNALQIVAPFGALILPKEVVAQLNEMIPAGKTADSISLRMDKISKDEVAKLISGTGNANNGAAVKAVSEVVDYKITVQIKGESDITLNQFAKPVTLKFQLTDLTDQNLAGLYYINDNGGLEYVGGKLEQNTLSAPVNHFSKYGVLTYNKEFSDVASQHWAYKVIKELAAKHVVEGVSDTQFQPESNVTRAQFVTMIVNRLNLKSTGPAQFKDVQSGSWYAQSVAAAFQNGIVEGLDSETFAPDKEITREEMAVMITRMYAKVTGSKTDAPKAAFGDSQSISTWAEPAINMAVQTGLMVGRTDNGFAPKEKATRAESSQVIFNLIKKQ